jgi:hypothetical protein
MWSEQLNVIIKTRARRYVRVSSHVRVVLSIKFDLIFKLLFVRSCFVASATIREQFTLIVFLYEDSLFHCESNNVIVKSSSVWD